MRTPTIDYERGMAMIVSPCPVRLFGKTYVWVRECSIPALLAGVRPEDQPLTLHRVEW